MLQLVRLLLTCIFGTALGFLYQPRSGQIWDPSCFASRDGNQSYYCVAMYQREGDAVNHYTAGLLFSSDDGVHWRDVGPVAPSAPGTQWWKGFVIQRPDGSYVMDHGVFENGKNDALRILTANGTDSLTDWTVAATSRPGDAYRQTGRWDHMYINLDDAPNGSAGYVGFPVSSPLNSTAFAGTWPGVLRSMDGVQWTAQKPLPVNWNGVSPQSIEEGGFERLQVPSTGDIDGDTNTSKWFLIGGGGRTGVSAYGMWVYEAESIDGPYRPAIKRFLLSGGGSPSFSGGALAAWCKGRSGERLISQYMTAQGKGRSNVWMLPLRAPVLDTEGLLRLGWWKSNEVMLGASLADHQIPSMLTCDASSATLRVNWLAKLDAAAHDRGVYLRARLAVEDTGSAGVAAVGLALEHVASNTSWPEDPTFAAGFDLPGDDLRWHAANYTDAHMCKAECTAEPLCAGWTFVRNSATWGGNGYPVPRCCLKGSAALPSFRPNPTCVSGLVRSLPPTPVPMPAVLPPLTAVLVDIGTDGAEGTASRVWRGGGASRLSMVGRSGSFDCGDLATRNVSSGTASTPSSLSPLALTCGVGTVTAVSSDVSHDVLLLFRKGMWELYIDGLLVRTYVYGSAYPLPAPSTASFGRVGFACSGKGRANLTDIKLGQLNL